MEAAVCAAIQENKLHSDQVHMVQIQASDKVSNRWFLYLGTLKSTVRASAERALDALDDFSFSSC